MVLKSAEDSDSGAVVVERFSRADAAAAAAAVEGWRLGMGLLGAIPFPPLGLSFSFPFSFSLSFPCLSFPFSLSLLCDGLLPPTGTSLLGVLLRLAGGRKFEGTGSQLSSHPLPHFPQKLDLRLLDQPQPHFHWLRDVVICGLLGCNCAAW